MARLGQDWSRSALRLLLLTAALGGCMQGRTEITEVERDAAERQELIAAMQNHPALAEENNADATGKPINVPTTVPKRPEGNDDHHSHPPPQPPSDPNARAR